MSYKSFDDMSMQFESIAARIFILGYINVAQ
jgi:hypothetical protein